jgi:hypothetical protein
VRGEFRRGFLLVEEEGREVSEHFGDEQEERRRFLVNFLIES